MTEIYVTSNERSSFIFVMRKDEKKAVDVNEERIPPV